MSTLYDIIEQVIPNTFDYDLGQDGGEVPQALQEGVVCL
jgi:hypothetical protein